MDDRAITIADKSLASIKQVVLDAVQSDETRRKYGAALDEFLAWYQEHGEPSLSKAVVQRYLAELREAGAGAASINQRRSAINKLIREALDNEAIPESIANGILRIKGEKRSGERLGNWLTREQAEELINSPDTSKLKGLRDRALLALAIGTGLRRSELAALKFEQVQMRDARWLLVDITGKRNKTRSVPMASWCKLALDRYTERAGISSGHIFRRIRRGDNITGQRLTAQAVYDVIVFYSQALFGDEGALAAHDTRRTYAHLALKGGAPIEQISLTLGHESIETTQRYLGVQLDLSDAPADRIIIKIENGQH